MYTGVPQPLHPDVVLRLLRGEGASGAQQDGGYHGYGDKLDKSMEVTTLVENETLGSELGCLQLSH